MRIDDSSTGPLRPLAPRADVSRPEPVTPRSTPDAPATSARPRRDSVQFSEAGRSMAARPEDRVTGLSAERREAIRQKALGGAYATVEMADQVARRLLARGEL
jgi:hypothetical protein